MAPSAKKIVSQKHEHAVKHAEEMARVQAQHQLYLLMRAKMLKKLEKKGRRAHNRTQRGNPTLLECFGGRRIDDGPAVALPAYKAWPTGLDSPWWAQYLFALGFLQTYVLPDRSVGVTRPIGDYKRNEWRTPEEAEKGKAFYAPVVQVLRYLHCLLYTSPSPRDRTRSRMPSSA